MTKKELETATTEKLISALEYCGRDSYYATYYDEVVDEITKRLKQNKELQEELKKWKDEWQEQIEKMKCCFNCKHSRTEYEHCRTNKHEKWELAE